MSAAARPALTRGPAFARDLRRHGGRTALIAGDEALTYDELADRVEAFADRLGPDRRLVLVTGGNDTATVVAHLGALAAGCPVLMAPPGDRVEGWLRRYVPAVVVDSCGVTERETGTRDLHPDLALLLTTSGSTGSPKLVRLSSGGLQAHAEAVADAVGVRPEDRAVTTLPLHYSYGLSVLHSHVARGAAVVLTDLSVVDACFWDLVDTAGVTTLPTVPYGFELLDRTRFAERSTPSLRVVTCAGGRLAPEDVTRWARVGQRRGWDLLVMYGQTEATARMAVLPPDLALEHPTSAGRALPGSSLRVDAPDETGLGEVVFSGPGVMLGYATGPADLALGRTVDELRTGDLGRLGPDGLLHLAGRRARIAKVLGLRVDLEHLEQGLAAEGRLVWCAQDGPGLVAAAAGSGDPDVLRRRVAELAGLPVAAVRAAHVGALPRTASGKPDRVAATALVPHVRPAAPSGDLLALYRDVLGRDDLTEADSFVSAGGDSLSYVELSLRLEDVLGDLPVGWHTTPVSRLRSRRGRTSTLETSVALRALAILAVVSFHSDALTLVGGAHVLVAVAGWNTARFVLGPGDRRSRLRQVRTSALRVAVPAALWAGAVGLVAGGYGLANVLQVSSLVGPDTWGPTWRLWFVEALVQLLALVAVVVAVPALDRLERARPFALAAGVVGAGLLVRYGLVPLPTGPDGLHTSAAVLWLFGLGWAACRAERAWQRAAVSVVLLGSLPGYFDDLPRAALVASGVLALVWLPRLPCPRLLRPVAGVLASSSLYVYLTHWQVYPHLEADHPWLGVAASLAVGIAAWRAAELVTRLAGRARAGLVPRLAGRAPAELVTRGTGRARAGLAPHASPARDSRCGG